MLFLEQQLKVESSNILFHFVNLYVEIPKHYGIVSFIFVTLQHKKNSFTYAPGAMYRSDYSSIYVMNFLIICREIFSCATLCHAVCNFTAVIFYHKVPSQNLVHPTVK